MRVNHVVLRHMLATLIRGLGSDVDRLYRALDILERLDAFLPQLQDTLEKMRNFEDIVSKALDIQQEKIGLLTAALEQSEGATSELKAALEAKTAELAAFIAEEQVEDAAQQEEDAERGTRQAAVLEKLRQLGLEPAEDAGGPASDDPSSVTLE